jgi:hypothetical protein
MKAVSQHETSLRYASFEIKNNRAVVMQAVKQDGRSLM